MGSKTCVLGQSHLKCFAEKTLYQFDLQKEKRGSLKRISVNLFFVMENAEKSAWSMVIFLRFYGGEQVRYSTNS
jgi:hypothetical protein